MIQSCNVIRCGVKIKKTLLYIYENHLFNFYKYHYITNVSVLIMQNLLDILKSLIWLLFWKTEWLLIDNFCQGRIYAPPLFFCLILKKIYIPDSLTPKPRNTPKHSKATIKTKPFFRVILKYLNGAPSYLYYKGE